MLTELVCLTMAVWFECRGCEKDLDRVAVAHVIINRKNDDSGEFRRRNTICDVVSQPNHFPWWGLEVTIENPIERSAWNNAESIARMVLKGKIEDPTDGALWFHTPNLRRVWTNGLEPVTIGSNAHVFWRQR